jgi:hypothetical protein
MNISLILVLNSSLNISNSIFSRFPEGNRSDRFLKPVWPVYPGATPLKGISVGIFLIHPHFSSPARTRAPLLLPAPPHSPLTLPPWLLEIDTKRSFPLRRLRARGANLRLDRIGDHFWKFNHLLPSSQGIQKFSLPDLLAPWISLGFLWPIIN